MPELSELSTPILVTLAVFASISLTLLVAGVIAVARTPREHLPGGLPRVAWLLLCLVQIVGPLTFFILRRRERNMIDETPKPRQSGDDSIIETLYG